MNVKKKSKNNNTHSPGKQATLYNRLPNTTVILYIAQLLPFFKDHDTQGNAGCDINDRDDLAY